MMQQWKGKTYSLGPIPTLWICSSLTTPWFVDLTSSSQRADLKDWLICFINYYVLVLSSRIWHLADSQYYPETSRTICKRVSISLQKSHASNSLITWLACTCFQTPLCVFSMLNLLPICLGIAEGLCKVVQNFNWPLWTWTNPQMD